MRIRNTGQYCFTSNLMAVEGISTSGLGALTTTPPARPRLPAGGGGGRGDSSPVADDSPPPSLGESEPGVARKALKAVWKSDMWAAPCTHVTAGEKGSTIWSEGHRVRSGAKRERERVIVLRHIGNSLHCTRVKLIS